MQYPKLPEYVILLRYSTFWALSFWL